MQTVRRDALRLLGAGIGAGVSGSVLSGGFGKAFAAASPIATYIDPYCYCGDVLVSAAPEAALNIVSTGDGFTKWATGSYRQLAPDLWVATSYFTGEQRNFIRFKVDPKRYTVEYDLGLSEAALRFSGAARVVPGKLLGYGDGKSIVADYAWHRAGANLDADMETRRRHQSGMQRIKALAEHGVPPENAFPDAEYLATSTVEISAPLDALFGFISDGTIFGKWTWGRSPRTKIGGDTFKCKSDYGGPDLLVRFDVDRERKTVDYYVGQKPEAMLLNQSARVFTGPTFGYDEKVSLVTFTRWRPAGQANYDWERAVGNQIQDMMIAKGQLEHGGHG